MATEDEIGGVVALPSYGSLHPISLVDSRNDDDVETSGGTPPPSGTRPLPPRQAFSMDDEKGDAATPAAPPSPPYPTSRALSSYVLASALFFGFCLGYSASSFRSGSYWESPEGLRRLGCAPLGGGASPAFPAAAASSVPDADKGEPNDEDDEEKRLLLHVLPYEHLMDGASFGNERHKHRHGEGNYGLESISGPPLIDIAKKMKRNVARSPVEIVGTARPNVYLNHHEGYSWLLDDDASRAGGGLPGVPPAFSRYSSDYFLVSSGLDAQSNQAYCSVATASAVINSLRFGHPRTEVGVDVPTDATYAPYAYATQHDLFGNCSQTTVIYQGGTEIRGVDGILTFPWGLGLAQVAALLQCHLSSDVGWTVTKVNVDPDAVSVHDMRNDLKSALSDPNARVLINYHRAEAGQVGGGHWSPLGSYSQSGDAFLIMDVAKYKYPPVWVPAERLYVSMATTDRCGEWDFPWAQDLLSPELRRPRTKEDAMKAARIVGCQEAWRGYVIVRKMDDGAEGSQ